MPELSSHLDRLSRYARRIAANTRPHHVVAVLAVAVVGIGLAGVSAMALPEPRPVLDGERLRIQVVAPVEPEITAGPVMEVGQLVDVLESAPPSYAMAQPADYVSHGDNFDDSEVREPPPPPKRHVEEALVRAPPRPEPAEPPERAGRVARWFGFDGPERDYRAEREARRARREARMEREGEGRERRWYRSDGRPVDDREVDRAWSGREDDPPPRDDRY
jgi:hypothetical protein